MRTVMVIEIVDDCDFDSPVFHNSFTWGSCSSMTQILPIAHVS